MAEVIRPPRKRAPLRLVVQAVISFGITVLCFERPEVISRIIAVVSGCLVIDSLWKLIFGYRPHGVVKYLIKSKGGEKPYAK